MSVYTTVLISVVMIVLSMLVTIVIVVYIVRQPKKLHDSPEDSTLNGRQAGLSVCT